MPWAPRKKFQDWPGDAIELPPKKVIELYESGFAGCRYDPQAMERFRANMRWPDGEAAAHEFSFADSGKDKLVVPFVFVLDMFPGCWPGKQGQGRGDCVSWSTRNAGLGTMVADIVGGLPDEESGKPEERPDVPDAGIADGVLSTESIYWYRGYDGDGWFCEEAAEIATKKSGLMIRKDYPELGVDLSSYSSRLAGKYGRQSPPSTIEDVTNDHLIHTATSISSAEGCRDYLFNGFFLTTCGGEGIEYTRDANGVSRRKGSWAHAMGWIGFDDRPDTKAIYNEPLVLDLNSWANWNNGPRDIRDSAKYVPAANKERWIQRGIVNATTGNIMIPEGSAWLRWSEFRNRSIIAFSGAKGWPRKVLPLDYSPF
jgi:hypothetical protein